MLDPPNVDDQPAADASIIALIKTLCEPQSIPHFMASSPELLEHFGAGAAYLATTLSHRQLTAEALAPVLSASKQLQQGWAWALLVGAGDVSELAQLLRELPPRSMVAAMQLLWGALVCERQGPVPVEVVTEAFKKDGVDDNGGKCLPLLVQLTLQLHAEWPEGGWYAVMVGESQAGRLQIPAPCLMCI